MTKLVFALLLTVACMGLQSQDFTIGFQAGLTYATLKGPVEMNGSEVLETQSLTSGFHVGATFNYKITDLFGFRAGLIFNQKGSNLTYEGPSYFFFRDVVDGQKTWLEGERSVVVKMTNANIDIPLLAYVKIGKFELLGGLYGSLLAATTTGGEFVFNGASVTSGASVDEIKLGIDYNHYRDLAKQGKGGPALYTVDGEVQAAPSILGAYYDLDEKPKSLLKSFDFGLSAGLNYFVNEGLYFGIDAQFGLADITNKEVDYSKQEVDSDFNWALRDDKDTNFALKFSVGFSF